MSRADVQSDGHIRWGILSNGRHWRLYYQGAKSRLEEFLEIDLPAALGLEGFTDDLFAPGAEDRAHWIKTFYLLFRRPAFTADPSFHRIALDEGRNWETAVAPDLSVVVFDQIFPELVRALAAYDKKRPETLTREYLDEVREAALTLLYRLLFVLYAEDRNLLPARDDRYDDYGFRKPVRQPIADRIDGGDAFSSAAGPFYQHTCQLFRLIDEGDASIGLPPYDGGLFDPRQTPLLDRAILPDAVFAPVIDTLARRYEGGVRKTINFRDVSVQQLGSIYERLLQFELAEDADGQIEIRPNAFARKTTGSYYTPEDLVQLIIERTVGPLLEEKRQIFVAKIAELESSRLVVAERIAAIAADDPATCFLDLKVCDPAMGSGHFLVSLVDYLADRVLEEMEGAAQAVPWRTKDPYVSPLKRRIDGLRRRVKEQAEEHGWAVSDDHLDDRHIVRRIILKRVIYGVDKNPMAVELAKLSLWLHTFTVGAPLSFLDHHLQCGDSLFGEWVRPVEDELREGGHGLFINSAVAQARNAARGMGRIEEITDADVGEVHESAAQFAGVLEATEPLARFLDVFHALRWNEPETDGETKATATFLDGQFGDPVKIASGVAEPAGKRGVTVIKALLAKAHKLAAEERFFHWETNFPACGAIGRAPSRKAASTR